MMTANKNTLTPFNGESIPQALKDLPRWAPWRASWNEKRCKWDKIPMQIGNHYGISTVKPDLWYTYDEALAAYQSNPIVYSGLGFCMTGVTDVVGIDLDRCVKDGVIAPWAQEIIDSVDSYVEISPSGHGLRILGSGSIPTDWNNHDQGIEVYGGHEGRFLTVTGARLSGSFTRMSDDTLLALSTKYAKERVKAEVIDLNIPDIIDDLLLPSLDNLDLHYHAKDFLTEGKHRGDRSRELHATAVALYSAGLDDAEVFSMLVQNEFAMACALDHRNQDYDRALLYLWREQCCKGKPKATTGNVLDDFENLEPATTASAKDRERFGIVTAADFLKRKPMKWLVKGVLPQAGLCVVYGDSGSGKTFFILDLVGSIVLGQDWRGKKVTKGNAVYICAEGAGGFRNRLKAYCEFNGVAPEDFTLGVLPDAPNLLEKADVKDLLTALHAFGKTDIVIVDTLAQSMPGGNENSGEDMGRVLDHCRAIHKRTGAMVVLIHHSGKDASRGARGWSGLRGAADAQIEIFRNGDERAAIIDKMKDGSGEGDEFGFKLNTVPVDVDEDGDTITSCTVEYKEGGVKANRRIEPKGHIEKLVLRIAQDLVQLSGDVHVPHLIDAAANQLPFDAAEGKRDRRNYVVNRALEKLVANGVISTANGAINIC